MVTKICLPQTVSITALNIAAKTPAQKIEDTTVIIIIRIIILFININIILVIIIIIMMIMIIIHYRA